MDLFIMVVTGKHCSGPRVTRLEDLSWTPVQVTEGIMRGQLETPDGHIYGNIVLYGR